jgi:hypothetical protein
LPFGRWRGQDSSTSKFWRANAGETTPARNRLQHMYRVKLCKTRR